MPRSFDTPARSPRRSSCAGRTGGTSRGHVRGAEPGRPAGRARRGSPAGPKLFVLDMFPYPSGTGLHVGHPLGYIGTDVYSPLQADDRLQRAVHDGLRRVRPAGRAVRGADRPAPGDHHRTPTSPTIAASCAASASATTRAAASAPPTPATTAGRSGSSCRSSTRGTTPTPTGGARPIDELIARVRVRAARATDDGRAWADLSPAERDADHRRVIAWRTSATRRSTGAPAWARWWPTKRSPPTVAATAATSRCSSATCASG